MRRRVVVAAVIVALVAAACGDRINDPMEMRPAAEPLDLVGLWDVGTATTVAGTRLRVDAQDLELIGSGGSVLGSWKASEDTLVAATWAYTGGGSQVPEPHWLVGVHPYVLTTDDGWQILEDDGTVLATMTRADATDENVPEITEATRRALRAPAALPDGLEPATAEGLLGRWVPAGEAFETDPHAEMRDDGTWAGTDGCNGVGGQWAVSDGGRLLATQGAMTAMWCPGAPVGSWLGEAARAGFDGEELVLLDPAATELARLVRG